MSEELDETSDEWPNALSRISGALGKLIDAADLLREEANAGYLDVSDAFRAHELYISALRLEHDPSDPDWRRSAESRPRSEQSLIKLIEPPPAFGAS